ncbi:hypothetical protein NOF04DRAFT_1216607 [Fusarium oxysporum II5]|nr:hypothetical protein NOF04DRAFT_1216607 [Fusarium oxysporum II5]
MGDASDDRPEDCCSLGHDVLQARTVFDSSTRLYVLFQHRRLLSLHIRALEDDEVAGPGSPITQSLYYIQPFVGLCLLHLFHFASLGFLVRSLT